MIRLICSPGWLCIAALCCRPETGYAHYPVDEPGSTGYRLGAGVFYIGDRVFDSHCNGYESGRGDLCCRSATVFLTVDQQSKHDAVQ